MKMIIEQIDFTQEDRGETEISIEEYLGGLV